SSRCDNAAMNAGFSRKRGFAAPDDLTAALDYEIAHEKASTLGRLGRQLEGALSALAAFDAAHDRATLSVDEHHAREMLVAEAGRVLWYFVVQREACGLRDSAPAMRDYGVPAEVRLRMGIFPSSDCRS